MSKLPTTPPVILQMYEAAARARGEQRAYLGMSGIGEPCALKIWLQFRGYTPRPIDGRANMIFDMGDRVEDAVIHWLREAGYQVDGQQDTFTAHNGWFAGHCDGVIHGITSRPHILEIKSANERRFNAFRTQGIPAVSPTYAAQVQCYMGYSGIDRALWVVMNKNDCQLYTERAYFNREEFERLHERARSIITAQQPPERTRNEHCQWCDSRTWCENPADGIQQRMTCGTCLWLTPGLEPMCHHHAHTFPIKRWNEHCSDWKLNDLTDVPF